MTTLLFFILFIALIFAGVPIAFSMGLASLWYMFVTDIPFNVIPQRMYDGIDDFVLLCIPGFILAGNLMNAGGITKRVINFAKVFVGHIRGGLGLTNVGSSMVFGGISGTALADTATIGSVMIPAMKKDGYDSDFSVAVTSSSSTIAALIPPSVPFIVVGTLAGIPIGSLFVAGIVPGIMVGVSLMVLVYIMSVKRQYPKDNRASFKEITHSFFGGFFAIMMVVIILYGILGGFFTPTEASIVAVVYALIVGKFIYKDLKITELPRIAIDSMITSASVMILVGMANLFGWIMVSEGIPTLIADTLLGITESPFLILLLIILLMLFIGTFMETLAGLIIMFPVLLPVATELGMDPIHFSVVMVLAMLIGLSTPPLGMCLYVASGIGNVSMTRASVALLPFITVLFAILLLVAYVPEVTLYLPRLFE